MIESLASGDIRVSRVSGTIESPNSVTVERIAHQPGIRKAGRVGSYLRDFREVRAVVALTALNLEAGFVVRVVRPGQIDLAAGHSRRRQVAGRIRKRIWSRRWCRRSRWSWRRCWRWRTATPGELERADTRAPVEAGSRRIVFVRVPEGAVVTWIYSYITVIAPATAGPRLTAGAREKSRFSLRQRTEWIGHQASCVSYLWRDCTARGAVANGDISLLVHRRAAHPAPGRIRLVGTLLELRYRAARHAAQFKPANAGDAVRADAVIPDH